MHATIRAGAARAAGSESCHRPLWEESRQNTKMFIGGPSCRQKTERVRLAVSVSRAERAIAEIDQVAAVGVARKDEI